MPMFEDQIATTAATISSQLIATDSAQVFAMAELIENLATANPTLFSILFIITQIWVLAWKGLALWRAGRLNHKFWFILILLINTLGIFEIIYYFYLSKQDWDKIGQKFGLIKKEV